MDLGPGTSVTTFGMGGSWAGRADISLAVPAGSDLDHKTIGFILGLLY